MIIDLIKEQKSDYLLFDVGDFLIFYNGEEYDYYQVIYDSFRGIYTMLCLDIAHTYESSKNLNTLISDANDSDKNNGFRLIEVLKPDEVVLRRVAND